MLSNIGRLILGVHLNNTIFAFNWHNVRHINRFLLEKSGELAGGEFVIADVGRGKLPYYPYFASACREHIAIDMEESLPN